MTVTATYQYARLWVPLYDDVALAVTRPVYLIESAEGFEGFVAEKNTTLMTIFNDLGRTGWRLETAPLRITTPSPEFQLLIDATLDEVEHDVSLGDVSEFDVFGMRRRVD